ncbi:hypothetical protein BDQ17DRAFT_1433997 [Cyathus striatus]|nr:hypothetical protein BDQ17DRAFT_1433997 [Cyathus striatus]
MLLGLREFRNSFVALKPRIDICIVTPYGLNESVSMHEPMSLSASGNDWSAIMPLNKYSEKTWKAYGTVGLDETEEFIRFGVLIVDETEIGHVDLSRDAMERSCAIGRSDIMNLQLNDDGNSPNSGTTISLGILHDPAPGATGVELVQDWAKSWGDPSVLYDKTLNLLPDADDMKPILLHQAGQSYYSRYTTSQSQNDINSAIESYEAAVKLLTPHKSNYALMLHDLGVALRLRKQTIDLEGSLKAFELSVAATPDGILLALTA